MGVVHLKVGDDHGDGEGHGEHPAQGAEGTDKHAEVGLKYNCEFSDVPMKWFLRWESVTLGTMSP